MKYLYFLGDQSDTLPLDKKTTWRHQAKLLAKVRKPGNLKLQTTNRKPQTFPAKNLMLKVSNNSSMWDSEVQQIRPTKRNGKKDVVCKKRKSNSLNGGRVCTDKKEM